MARFYHPHMVMRWLVKHWRLLSIAAALLLGAGLYLGLIASPPDYQQGESVRIMYVHVPSAWMALGLYVGIALLGGGFLIWRNPASWHLARALAPLGTLFCATTLMTGMLWGKPIWGTWWEWDGRMTSMLILLFLYLGYLALSESFEQQERGAKAASVLALVGVINVPIIKFSVDWWHTLHQPASVFRFDGPTIHPSMLWPLMVMWLGFIAFTLAVTGLRLRAHTRQAGTKTL